MYGIIFIMIYYGLICFIKKIRIMDIENRIYTLKKETNSECLNKYKQNKIYELRKKR